MRGTLAFLWSVFLGLGCGSTLGFAQEGWFPFLPPVSGDGGVTSARFYRQAGPAGAQGGVTVADGHLWVGGQRLKLLGTNLTFAGALPTHDDADALAARLARFGINIVRLHHLDSQASPRGLFLKGGLELDPAMVDRLDYLAAALGRQGIYTDLNLHVGRLYPGLPVWDAMPRYFKGVDQFDATAGALQRDYARRLLGHTNPYTGHRWADDPAVALVEINNENGLIREWHSGALDEMPGVFQDQLSAQWRRWLRARYGDDAAVAQAWKSAASVAAPRDYLVNPEFRPTTKPWTLQVSGTAQATLEPSPGPSGQGGVKIRIGRVSSESWHVQLFQTGVTVQAGRVVRLGFWARSDLPKVVTVAVMQASAPWARRWAVSLALGPGWKYYQAFWTPDHDEGDLRLNWGNLADAPGTVQWAGVEFRDGVDPGLAADETVADDQPGSLKALTWAAYGGRSPAAQRDWMDFLVATETGYWTGLASYLKQDLGVKCPIVGTQASYSPLSVQVHLDVVDNHRYWRHPVFPQRPWDPVNWWVGSDSMSGIAGGGTLVALASQRAWAKPYIVTEYNHPSPNPTRAEAFPLLASLAAVQDWDGIFVYEWASRDASVHAETMERFFDIDADPARLVGLPFAAALLKYGVGSGSPKVFRQTTAGQRAELVRTGTLAGALSAGMTADDAFRGPVGWQAAADVEAPVQEAVVHDPGQGPLVWNPGPQGAAGRFALDTSWACALTGPAGGRYSFAQSGVTLTAPTWPEASTVLFWSVDGQGLTVPGAKVLVVAGDARNTGEVPHEVGPGRITVGKNWGAAPVLVEGLSVEVTLPLPANLVRVWALDASGARREEKAVVSEGSGSVIRTSADDRTLWYEVEVSN